MPFSLRILSATALASTTATALLAHEAEDAYRIRASIYANDRLVTAATWVGVIDRSTSVQQSFSTPYRRETGLNDNAASVEGALEGDVTMAIRPFRYGEALCLNVEISSHTVSQLHHYRSETLLEVLPGGGGYSAGGDYCDFTETADGLLFDLSLGDKSNYAEILVAPEKAVMELE